MVLLLNEALDVPLRYRNEMLSAAGFEPMYREPDINDALAGPLVSALEVMFANHEPLPMVVFDRIYTSVRANRAGGELIRLGWPEANEPNLLKLIFSAQGQETIENWTELAVSTLRRLQRELLYHPDDEELQELLSGLVKTPGVPNDWQQPKAHEVELPLHSIKLRIGQDHLSFLMSVTVFDAPQNVTLNTLHIESWFPLDTQTQSFCEQHLAK